MAESKYKGGFGHKQAKTPAKKQKPMMTYEELAKYVKSVNPYKGVAGVVNEVAGALYPKIAEGGSVAPKAVEDYFENNIPYSVQMSGAYIQEMVKQYRAEHGLKPAKASDEAVAYIRDKIQHEFLPLKEVVTAVSMTDLAKMVNKKTGLVEVKDYAKDSKDGLPAVKGYSKTEFIGGKIKYLYEDSQKFNIASQFRRENVIKLLTERRIDFTNDDVEYILTEYKKEVERSKRFKRGVQNKNDIITEDIKKPPRAFIRGIEDYGDKITTAVIMRNVRADPKFIEQVGKNVTLGDVERDFSESIKDMGVVVESKLNLLRDTLKSVLKGRTTERMLPFILDGIKTGVAGKSGEEISEAIRLIYADGLAPANVEQLYKPQVLAGWVYKVLPRLWVPAGIVSTIYSACFNETRAEVVESLKGREKPKKRKGRGEAIWNSLHNRTE